MLINSSKKALIKKYEGFLLGSFPSVKDIAQKATDFDAEDAISDNDVPPSPLKIDTSYISKRDEAFTNDVCHALCCAILLHGAPFEV